jgi:hypothetical protein
MAIGGNRAGRNSPFERMLDDLEEAESLFRRNGSVGAAAIWPGAGPTPSGESFFQGDAVISLYAESQSRATPEAPAAESKKLPERGPDMSDIRRELAAARSLGELKSLRRRCALAAHPDLVAPMERPGAERLMAEVNAAIDLAIKDGDFPR